MKKDSLAAGLRDAIETLEDSCRVYGEEVRFIRKKNSAIFSDFFRALYSKFFSFLFNICHFKLDILGIRRTVPCVNVRRSPNEVGKGPTAPF